ncbi:MAG TPA: arabinose transporter [Oleiagrimonas sp.]|nr:arabinose transporter [Oleiagrimonas sp.]
MTFTSTSARDPALARLWLLAVVLFVSYLCVAIPLAVVAVYTADGLGLGNAWAGLAVGIAFASTIVTRGWAGGLADRRGAKITACWGLALYAAGALVSMVAGWLAVAPGAAYAVLIAGRLLVGLGESLTGVGIITWGIGLVGPVRSGKVLSLVGAAIYGALAVGGPLGLGLYQAFGFAGAMAVSVVLPILGLLVIRRLPAITRQPDAVRPPLRRVIRQISWHGLVVCLQGIGFAAIGAFFVLYFQQRGWAYAGLGFTTFGVGFVLVRIVFGHLPDRIGGLRVAALSLAMEAIGQLLIWGATDPAAALTGAFMTGLGCSMIFPAMGREVVHRVEPHLRGTALGGFAAFQDLAYGLTGPLAGLLADRAGYDDVFLIGAVAAAGGLLVALGLRHLPPATAGTTAREFS